MKHVFPAIPGRGAGNSGRGGNFRGRGDGGGGGGDGIQAYIKPSMWEDPWLELMQDQAKKPKPAQDVTHQQQTPTIATGGGTSAKLFPSAFHFQVRFCTDVLKSSMYDIDTSSLVDFLCGVYPLMSANLAMHHFRPSRCFVSSEIECLLTFLSWLPISRGLGFLRWTLAFVQVNEERPLKWLHWSTLLTLLAYY